MTESQDLQKIIRLPRVTEASTADVEANNSYHFAVAPEANKIQVRQAVEKLFGVKVLSVKTMNVRGKQRRRFTKTGWNYWSEKDWKKAIVKLKPGDTLPFQ